jgi:hypothetical protein
LTLVSLGLTTPSLCSQSIKATGQLPAGAPPGPGIQYNPSTVQTNLPPPEPTPSEEKEHQIATLQAQVSQLLRAQDRERFDAVWGELRPLMGPGVKGDKLTALRDKQWQQWQQGESGKEAVMALLETLRSGAKPGGKRALDEDEDAAEEDEEQDEDDSDASEEPARKRKGKAAKLRQKKKVAASPPPPPEEKKAPEQPRAEPIDMNRLMALYLASQSPNPGTRAAAAAAAAPPTPAQQVQAETPAALAITARLSDQAERCAAEHGFRLSADALAAQNKLYGSFGALERGSMFMMPREKLANDKVLWDQRNYNIATGNTARLRTPKSLWMRGSS